MRGEIYLTWKARKKAKKLVKLCKKQGLLIKITDTFRTEKEQDSLYLQGRRGVSGEAIVTNARGRDYSSMHQWGVAFDICRIDGRGAYYNGDLFFQKVGKIGKEIGLIWGGDWTSPRDMPHFQLKKFGNTPVILKSMYNNPTTFLRQKHIVLYKRLKRGGFI